MPGPNSFRARRATVDDLPALVEIWTSMHLDVLQLERRLTEFQVAENLEGSVTGAIGFQISGRDSLIHNEAFADFAQADAMRAALWERLQRLAENHGVYRAWTQETAPFWNRNGFTPPAPDIAIPTGLDPGGRWLTLPLREVAAQPAEPAVVAEFELYRQAERARTEELLTRAKAVKVIGWVLGSLLFLAVLAMTVYFVRHKPQ